MGTLSFILGMALVGSIMDSRRWRKTAKKWEEVAQKATKLAESWAEVAENPHQPLVIDLTKSEYQVILH